MTALKTGYFQQLPDFSSKSCDVQLTQNYKPYDIFVLKNNFEIYVNKIYQKNYQVIISAVEKDFRIYLIFILSDGTQDVELTEQQKTLFEDMIAKMVNSGISHVLIYSYFPVFINSIYYSETQLRKILPFVRIPTEYDPKIDSLGLHVNLREVLDYDQKYADLITIINNQIHKFYIKGVVFHPSLDIIKNWELIPYISEAEDLIIPNQEISSYTTEIEDVIIPNAYYPNWVDNRFLCKYNSMFQFLTTRVNGHKDIYFKVGANNVIRHYLAKLCHQLEISFSFDSEYIKLEIVSLKMGQQILALIDDFINKSYGEVFILTYARMYNILINNSVVTDLKDKISDILDYTDYIVHDQQNKHVFSVRISVGANMEYIRNLLLENRQILLDTIISLKENRPETIISQKLGGEFKNISVYELIEQKWIPEFPKLNFSLDIL